MKTTQTRAVQHGDKALYSAIILLAIRDAASDVYKHDVINFIGSDWFTYLCRALDIHVGYARRIIRRQYIYGKVRKKEDLYAKTIYQRS